MIYADNSATTRVRPEVLEAMLPYLAENCGNASSIHAPGRAAREAIDNAREQVAALLNCRSEEVYFTPCGTTSNNVAILGRARFLKANGKGQHLITTSIEHPSAFGPAQFLESQGWSVTYLPVNSSGLIDPEKLATAITSNTSMISIIWANNEIGSVQPIEKLAEIAKAKEIFFHSDAVQVPGKLPIDLSRVAVSSLSASGHKFHAPKGIGFLFLREGINVMPIEFGGGQEHGLFPGTEAVADVVAIGKAAELARLDLDSSSRHLRQMQDILLAKIKTFKNVVITGPQKIEERIPGHVSLAAPGIEGESLVMRLDLQGICVSSGSACHHGVIEPSHVLKAIGLSKNEAMGSLRISLGRFNTDEELQKLLGELEKLLAGKLAQATT